MKFISSKIIIILSIFYFISVNFAYSFNAPKTFSDLAGKLSP